MNENALVSVIVPVYQVGQYIENTIESILQQTYENIEIILVDDGSLDDSGKICDRYSKMHGNIKAYHKKNGGLVSAWRYGLMLSKGKLVVFVDGDDWIEKNHIKSMMEEYYESNSDIVSQTMILKKNEEEIPIVGTFSPGRHKMTLELKKIILHESNVCQVGIPWGRCSKLIKKNLLLDNLKYSYINATFEEDLNIMLPVFLDASKISIIHASNANYIYRWDANSMLHSYNKKMADSVYHVFQFLYQAVKEKKEEICIIPLNEQFVLATIRCLINEFYNYRGKVFNNDFKKIINSEGLINALSNIRITHFPMKYRPFIYIISNKLMLKLLLCSLSLRNRLRFWKKGSNE